LSYAPLGLILAHEKPRPLRFQRADAVRTRPAAGVSSRSRTRRIKSGSVKGLCSR